MNQLVFFVLMFSFTSVGASELSRSDKSEVTCTEAINEAKNQCSIWDDPDYGDGDHEYDMVCLNKIMTGYGFSSDDYAVEDENYHAKPIYNEYFCIEDLPAK